QHTRTKRDWSSDVCTSDLKDKIKKYRYEFDIKENDLVVTFIGRLVAEKGIFDLLEAFEGIKQKDIKLLIIGGTMSSERDQYSERSEERRVGKARREKRKKE